MKKIARFAAALFVCALLFGILSPAADAADTVRVGYMQFGRYGYTDKNGEVRGFDPELIEKVAQYGGLKVVLVPFVSASEAMDVLRAGGVDMLSDFERTDDRAEQFLFSDYPLITQSCVLYARADDERFEYGSVEQLAGMKIGCMEGTSVIQRLRALCQEHGVAPDILEYRGETELHGALDSGGIDAAASGNYPHAGYRTILSFAPSSSYFMFRRDETQLKSTVDDAVNRLTADSPLYVEDLYNKYIRTDASGMSVFTSAEKSYIAEHGPVTVAVVKDAAPFVKFTGGQAEGIIPAYFGVLAQRTGLTFSFVPCGSSAEAAEAVRSGRADVLGFYYGDIITASGQGLSITAPYTTLNCVQITRSNYSGTPATAAVTDRTLDIIRVQLSDSSLQPELRNYPNLGGCYDALMHGDVDSMICTMTAATWMVNQHGIRRLTLSTMPELSLDLSGAVNENGGTLRTILDKAIGVSESDIQRIITQNTASGTGNLQTVIENAPAEWIIVLTVFLLLLVLSLSYALFALTRRQKERAGLAAEKAENERRQLRLDTAEKANEERNRFFSSISHDMRTPLNAIIGFSDLAQKEALPAKARDYLAKIHLSGSLLLDLINDTLTISKINSGKMQLSPEPVDSEALLSAVVVPIREVADRKGVAFAVDNQAPRRVILADRLNTQKILLNLLSNAVKYTPRGGRVTFSVRQEPGKDGEPDSVFTIGDNGIGMSPDFLPRAFDPFVQEGRSAGRSGGTGLGLSIVKQLVDLMGGSIGVKSELNRGTIFTVRLRFRTAPAGAAPAPAGNDGAGRGVLSGKKLLLCEDNPLNSEIACALLGSAGMQVVTAENGRAGVDAFSASAPGEFSAILMDIRMPVLDGCGAARAIRSLPRTDAQTVPIVAMTADAFEEDVKRCFDAGMNGHIAKPLDPDRVFDTLAALLRADG